MSVEITVIDLNYLETLGKKTGFQTTICYMEYLSVHSCDSFICACAMRSFATALLN